MKAVAVFVGKADIGSWQGDEVQIFLQDCKKKGFPIIPVILADVPADDTPKLPPFLEVNQMVDYRKSDLDPTEQLVWGITGVKVATSSAEPPAADE